MKKHCITFLFLFCAMATYAQSELIKNFSFEEEPKPIRNRRFGPKVLPPLSTQGIKAYPPSRAVNTC